MHRPLTPLSRFRCRGSSRESVISLSNGVCPTLLEHAREGAPEEVCGVLGGRRGNASRVESVHQVPNVATRPRTEYRIDPEAQLDAMETIEAAGRGVVGFYHSHPTGPREPSETDAAWATWPGFHYLVVSLDGLTVGAWRWDGERFENELLTISSG